MGEVDEALRGFLGGPVADVELLHSTDHRVFDGCAQEISKFRDIHMHSYPQLSTH